MQVIEAQCSWFWRLTITSISNRSGRFASFPWSGGESRAAGTMSWRVLPALPMHDLLEGTPVGPGKRPQRPVSWVTQADQENGPVTVREPQHTPRLLLIDDSRVARADAKVRRGQHHVRGRLAEVIHQPVALPLIVGFLGHQRDRRRR